MKKAVIYARFSSYGQTEQSIEGQLRVCHEYAKREGMLVVNEYIDRAISGSREDRPALLQAIKDSKKQEFDFLLVWKLDRFSRDRVFSVIQKDKLKKNGVKVLSATEPLSDTKESMLIEGQLETLNAYFLLTLSENVRRGLKENLLKGQYIGGVAPYGYKVIDRKVYIDDSTAWVIKYLFEEYAKGVPKKKIIEELNKKGARSRKGNALTLASFKDTLSNKKYIGTYEHEGEVYDNIYPAIVSKKLFDEVQKKIKKRRRAKKDAESDVKYLLSGKVFCGHCGSSMIAERGTSKSKSVYHYYACHKKKKKQGCEKLNEKKDFLEYYIVEQTLDYILMPERIDYISKKMSEEYEKEFSASNIAKFENQIKQIDKDLDKCFDLIFKATTSSMIERTEEKVKKLENQKADLEIELSKMRITSNLKFSIDDIKKWLTSFAQGNINDEYFREKIINVFVNSVYVYDDKMVIYYNIQDCKQVSFIDNQTNIEEAEPQEHSDIVDECSFIKSTALPIHPKNEHRFIFDKNIFGVIFNRKRLR